MKLAAIAALAALTLAPAASTAALPQVRAVVVSASSGAKLAEATGAPRPLGAAIGDGRGGFFAAGGTGVTRLRANGTADPSFSSSTGEVDGLALTAGVLVTAGPALKIRASTAPACCKPVLTDGAGWQGGRYCAASLVSSPSLRSASGCGMAMML